MPGKLRFYVQAKDKDGEELDSHGSKKEPAELKIVSRTEEEPPSYPGQPAPTKCMEASACPEDMIGTPACPGTGGAGKTVACGICHGDTLKGVADVPKLAGLHPVYLVRQLCNFQTGTSNGASAALMKKVDANLTEDDMIAIAAYASAQTP